MYLLIYLPTYLSIHPFLYLSIFFLLFLLLTFPRTSNNQQISSYSDKYFFLNCIILHLYIQFIKSIYHHSFIIIFKVSFVQIKYSSCEYSKNRSIHKNYSYYINTYFIKVQSQPSLSSSASFLFLFFLFWHLCVTLVTPLIVVI